MALKNINAVFALLTAVLLALHNTINGCLMIAGRVYDSPSGLAHVLSGLFAAHMAVSLYVLLFKTEEKKVKYTNISKGWLIQRLTGIGLVPLVAFHGFACAGILGAGLTSILVTHFFIMVLAYIHIPLSVPNALVTLGIIDSTKQYATVRKICWVICALLFLIGFYASFAEVVGL